MSYQLYLFCGGSAIDQHGRPKPLMKVCGKRSLLIHYLIYLQSKSAEMPESITLLCDDSQEVFFKDELLNLSYPIPIHIVPCGHQSTTLEKFYKALYQIRDYKYLVKFSYPDIFSFDENIESHGELLSTNGMVCISAVALKSRFPRLTIDIYKNEVRGISNYLSSVPANPLYVFGGELWGRVDQLNTLIKEFKEQSELVSASLEYDFFFWIINRKNMRCNIFHGERLWIDSVRDINQLLVKTGHLL